MNAWRAFLCAFTLDRFADMLWTTTLVWLATEADNPSAQGLIVAAAMAPQLAVLMYGGALADRYGSARVASVTTVGKAALLVVLLATTQLEWSGLALLALIAALVGAVDGFHDPAMDSWGARLKRPEDQTSAASTEAILWRVGQLGGSALGGLLLGASAVLALGATVALYLAQRVFLGAIKAKGAADKVASEDTGQTAQQRVQDALSFLRDNPVLWATMSVQAVCTITIGGVMMLLLPNLVREQEWHPVVYGIAVSAFGAGMMLGATGADRYAKARGSRAVGTVPFLAFATAAAGHAVLWVVAGGGGIMGPAGLCVALLVFGGLTGTVGPLLSGYRRSITPETQQGALAAAARLLTLSPEPLGPIAAGVIIGAGGLSTGLWTFGAAGVAAGGVGALGAWRAERGAVLTT